MGPKAKKTGLYGGNDAVSDIFSMKTTGNCDIMKKKGGNAVKKIIKIFLIVVLAIILAAALLLGYLTLTEYNPDKVTPLTIEGSGVKAPPSKGEEITILTWNTGYAALGKDADFIMDGGGNAPVASKDLVLTNIEGIKNTIAEVDPDIIMLQEVDQKSSRSYKINQIPYYEMSNYTFALNYKCDFVPFPWPPIAKVQSGVLTTTDYEISSADRVSLPCPFSWPLKIANLKRCLNVSRIPTSEGNELVIVNFHLEAYDSGEGKIAQTKELVALITEEYEKGNYVIAGGDFNQTFPGSLDVYPNTHEDLWAVGLLEESALPQGWSMVYDISYPTCRLLNQPYDPSDTENTQYYVIDGFIYSPNVQIRDVETINKDFEYSDHNPIRLVIELK